LIVRKGKGKSGKVEGMLNVPHYVLKNLNLSSQNLLAVCFGGLSIEKGIEVSRIGRK
jgi:hypothetical protein